MLRQLKLEGSCSTVSSPLKNTEEDKKEVLEATVSLATVKEVGADVLMCSLHGASQLVVG